MYISNIWGIFFCCYLPMILIMFATYTAGYETARRRYRTNTHRRAKRNVRNKMDKNSGRYI